MRTIIIIITTILLSACGFTSEEKDVEFVEETGVVKEVDESATRILVTLDDKFEGERVSAWFLVSEEILQELAVEDEVSVTYNRREAQISDPPVYEGKTIEKKGG